MPEYIRPKQTYSTIDTSYEVIDGVVNYTGRKVVKDTDTAKDYQFMNETTPADRACIPEPTIDRETYMQFPNAFVGFTVIDEPKKKYPQWPEWDIPEEQYPNPWYVWIDYPEPEPDPEGETGEEGETDESGETGEEGIIGESGETGETTDPDYPGYDVII